MMPIRVYLILNLTLVFFLSKKDQCEQCKAYKNATGEEQTKLEEFFNEHQEEKE